MAAPGADDRRPRLAHLAETLKDRLARKRAAMRAVMAAERVWPLVVPILCIAALFVALSWFGYFHVVPNWLRFSTLALLIAGLLRSVVALRTFRWPSEMEVDRRLERINGIVHQALAVQDDRLENESGFSRALWIEHRRRMAARLAELRVGPPEPDTPRRDPYALRALVLFLFVTAFAFSYSSRSGFLTDAFVFNQPGSSAAPVRVDAWVTPPAYTGRAPIFLTRAETPLPDQISVPEGSMVTVRVSGGEAGTISYQAANDEAPVAIAPAGAKATKGKETQQETAEPKQTARTYEFKAAESGTLAVAAGGGRKAWSFDVVADTPPDIAFDGEPQRAVNGALELAYAVKDDYGVAKARADIVPVDTPAADAHPLYGTPDFPLTLPGSGARSGKARSSRDLTDHPLAGKRVRIMLVATDAAGHEGRSATKEITLPARYFNEPLARAVVEERQTFALDTKQMPRALELADALDTAPEETIANLTHYLLLRSARTRMAIAYDDDTMRDAADYLWQIALGIENGDMSLAEQRLRNAQRALSEALRNNASDEEISRLMKELRQAMNDFLKEMAKTMPRDQNAEVSPNMKNVLRQQDLERMMDQIENLARSGQRDQAQQLLSELQHMMNNLQAGRPQQGQQGQNSPMRKQMDKLGELMQQQQQLMDQTHDLNRQLQERMGQEGQQGEENQQGQQGQQQMTAEQLRQALKELRKQQQGLQNQLGQLQKDLKGLGIKPGKGFGEAGEAMGNATGALGKGEGERALGEQGRALQALRQGAQDMMNQMMQAMGRSQGPGQGQQRGDQMGENNRDPLGRPRSTTGPDFGDQVKVPDEIDIQRAREILDQIRKRLGDALSPEMERRYLERLLDMN